MRPINRCLLILALATALSILFRLVTDDLTLKSRLHWPPGWYCVQGDSYRIGAGPKIGSRSLRAVAPLGTIVQATSLINGAYRPVLVSVRYRAPAGGAVIGLVGDATPSVELKLMAEGAPNVPGRPDALGAYKIRLPAAREWKRVRVLVQELSDIPRLSLSLEGPAGGASAWFADASVAYQDRPSENMLRNGDFGDNWGLWARSPEWIWLWAPAWRLAVFSLLFIGVAARRRHRDDRLTAWARAAAWVTLSALVVMSAGALNEMAQSLAGGLRWSGTAEAAAWAIQLGVFVLLGRAGAALAGRAAPALAPVVVALAVLAMSPVVAVTAPEGAVQPVIDTAQFFGGTGPIWLLSAFAALALGAALALRGSSGTGATRQRAGQKRKETRGSRRQPAV
jgi:hypothetical protein